MSASLRFLRAATAPCLLGIALLTSAPVVHAAGARIDRPATDAAPAAPALLPRPPFVFAPSGGPRVIDPANPMRETSPGVYEGIVPVRMPDGSWQVDLDERFMQFSVARRADGGGFAHSCVSGLDGLMRWQGAAPGCVHAPVTQAAVQPKVTTPTGTVITKWEAQ